ncbi:hypothetical protein E2C01_023982 [Portunus trituberculatus]|uniref:Uncharacterized protein n=1 Tax=Portunus trituberculatus TaxID=210409 RepID=A0A5B7E9H8_PORTR|nr:hypothetical protein [Portunus trituberculatus]
MTELTVQTTYPLSSGLRERSLSRSRSLEGVLDLSRVRLRLRYLERERDLDLSRDRLRSLECERSLVLLRERDRERV